MWTSPATRARAVQAADRPQPTSHPPQKDNSMTASPELGTASAPPRPDLLKSVFRQHAAGVAVITAQRGGRPVGFTATSLNSVAAEPPLVSFGIGTGVLQLARRRRGRPRRRAHTRRAPAGPGRHLRPQRRRPVRRRPPPGAPGPEGVPVLDGVLAWLVCRVVARVPAGRPPHRARPGRSPATRPAPGARCSTTRAASTRCATESSAARTDYAALARSQFKALAYWEQAGCTGE